MTHDRVLIFGTGTLGADVYYRLAGQKLITVIGFIDNAPKKHGQTFLGLPIYAPLQLSTLSFSKIVIASDAHTLIKAQLKTLDLGQPEVEVANTMANCSSIDEISSWMKSAPNSPSLNLNRVIEQANKVVSEIEAIDMTYKLSREHHNVPFEFWLFWYRYWALKFYLNAAKICKRLAARKQIEQIAKRPMEAMQIFSAYDLLGETSNGVEWLQSNSKFPYGFHHHHETVARLYAKNLEIELADQHWSKDDKTRDLNSRYNLQGIDFSDHESHFKNAIRGKRVAIVGPANTGYSVGSEIDGFDTVIRTNFFPSDDFHAESEFHGTKSDITYLINHKMVRSPELQETFYKILGHASDTQSLLVSSPGMLRDTHKLSPKLKFRPYTRYPIYQATLSALPSIIFDVLRYKPKEVKVFNATLYSGKTTYRKGYIVKDKGSQTTLPWNEVLVHHDLTLNFELSKKLFSLPQVNADQVLKAILEQSTEQYHANLRQSFRVLQGK